MYNILSIGRARQPVCDALVTLPSKVVCGLGVVYCNECGFKQFFSGIFVCSQSGDNPLQDVKFV
jgi:hypothetical protein